MTQKQYQENQYFDIVYRSPSGIQGTHVAVSATSLEDAVAKSPVMLSYGTPWLPQEFTVLYASRTPDSDIPAP